MKKKLNTNKEDDNNEEEVGCKDLLAQFKDSHFKGVGPFTTTNIESRINCSHERAERIINHGLSTRELYRGFMGYYYFS
jgi:hypothetical protein